MTNLIAHQKERNYHMIEFIPIGDRGEHLVPQEEQDEHCAFDFCPCHPIYRWANGQYLWFHKVSEERDLLEQAEAIRQVVSINLWHQAKARGDNYDVIKFPEGFTGAHMPPAAKR